MPLRAYCEERFRITVKPKNREHQKYFWNVIVLRGKSQSGVRKLNQKQER